MQNEIRRACSTYIKQVVHTRVWWADLREGNYLNGLGIDGRIILKWVFKWDATA
jgi:hypothetical protein